MVDDVKVDDTPVPQPLNLQLDNALHRRIRRALFALYFSQLVLQIVVICLLKYLPNTTASVESFVVTKQYVWACLAILVVCLFILYQKRCMYPLNLMVLSLYTVFQGILFAEIDIHFTTSISVCFCVSFLLIIVIMGVVSLIATSETTLINYRNCAITATPIVVATSTIVNFAAKILDVTQFFIWQGVLVVFVLWFTYVASRISIKFVHYLKYNEPRRVMLYYTDIMLFVFFIFSLVFSCIAFEGCACCGASDDIPGGIDFRYPLDESDTKIVIIPNNPNAVAPKPDSPQHKAMDR
ncbi:hypothetical protein THRCLA_20239 [Thraustotheca clavata]|uniref:Transmembrane protein n=1 Tax=Thraustotheca clavata TaxID=74557 RepID=A0A1W0AA21_9STRA|nr:hypothetical protein THRCLA_20239 [Thraustotheca clavata]